MIKALGGSKIFQMGAEEDERERERKNLEPSRWTQEQDSMDIFLSLVDWAV